MSQTERRRARRLPVDLRIEFDSGTGLSRDVSGLGIFFVTDSETLSAGDQIRFTMFIPDAVNVQCEGRVVRVSREEDGKAGVACTIDSFDLAEEVHEAGASHIVIRELIEHQAE